jgi:hypothetical protein
MSCWERRFAKSLMEKPTTAGSIDDASDISGDAADNSGAGSVGEMFSVFMDGVI